MNVRKALRNFVLYSLMILVVLAGIVVLVDPFFHYHAPLGRLKAVITKPEYQCIGSVEHLPYDSVILGSSVAENYNNHWFDEAFDCKSIKAIQKSAETVDLKYYFEEAVKTHEVKNVFYNLDVFAMCNDINNPFPDETMPTYLFDKNLLNDVKYLWNKDVLLEDIPYVLAMSFIGNYDEGESLNWWQWKTFGREAAIQQYHYTYLNEVLPMQTKEEYQATVDANIDLLEEMVKLHPEINFYFIYPPYSMMRWDEAYRGGTLEAYYYANQSSMERLLPYENVRIHYFQDEEEIICNLDLYMDTVHYSKEINHLIVNELIDENYLVTKDNYLEKMKHMEELVDRILTVDRLEWGMP